MRTEPTKVLLFIAPFFDIQSYLTHEIKSRAPIFTVPYGVLSLAAYIDKFSFGKVEIKVIDLNVKAYRLCLTSNDLDADISNYIQSVLTEYKADIVGISALFNTCYPYLEMVGKAVKTARPEALLIAGGGLATNLYAEILENVPHIDAACYGEGEVPMVELINALDRRGHMDESPAWITRASLAAQAPIHGIFVHDLDQIPFFDYSLIDLDDYSGRETDNTSKKSNYRNLSIHTSRGCPFRCVFCASNSVHGKKVRFMSVDKVVGEVRRMIDELGLEVLAIDDDHFLAKKDRAKEILNKLMEFNLRIEFPNGIAVYAIDDEIGEMLKRAGVTTISLAVESGSNYVLKHVINKPLKLEMVRNAVNILRKNDISVHAGFVVGLPGELEVHRDETMQLIFDYGFDWCYFNLAVPVAGSRLYKICKDNNYLVNDELGNHITMKCNIKTPDLDPEYMEEKAYMMNLEANFVNNFNMRTGNYAKAMKYFRNVAEKYPDHAFSHYYLAKALEGMGTQAELAAEHLRKFRELAQANESWNKYSKHYGLI